MLEPFLFCNPVDKNGEGIHGGPPLDHLTCYFTSPPGPVVGPVQIQNQFHLDTLLVNEPIGLCVPSNKDTVGAALCGSTAIQQCDGACSLPTEMCVDPGGGCVCVPTTGPCGLVAGPPLCYGDCPPLQACVDTGGACMCM